MLPKARTYISSHEEGCLAGLSWGCTPQPIFPHYLYFCWCKSTTCVSCCSSAAEAKRQSRLRECHTPWHHVQGEQSHRVMSTSPSCSSIFCSSAHSSQWSPVLAQPHSRHQPIPMSPPGSPQQTLPAYSGGAPATSFLKQDQQSFPWRTCPRRSFFFRGPFEGAKFYFKSSHLGLRPTRRGSSSPARPCPQPPPHGAELTLILVSAAQGTSVPIPATLYSLLDFRALLPILTRWIYYNAQR